MQMYVHACMCTMHMFSPLVTHFFTIFVQSVDTPNGLIATMFGPVEGRWHDTFMLGIVVVHINWGNLISLMESHLWYVETLPTAYQGNILGLFCGARPTAEQQQFNKSMSRIHISVEWGSEKYAASLLFFISRKTRGSCYSLLEKDFLVASVLINCHTCLYGSLTSTYFDVNRPSLETYLSNHL